MRPRRMCNLAIIRDKRVQRSSHCLVLSLLAVVMAPLSADAQLRDRPKREAWKYTPKRSWTYHPKGPRRAAVVGYRGSTRLLRRHLHRHDGLQPDHNRPSSGRLPARRGNARPSAAQGKSGQSADQAERPTGDSGFLTDLPSNHGPVCEGPRLENDGLPRTLVRARTREGAERGDGPN